MRQLASIQKVKSIKPIAKADLIVQIEILGWTCVAKKNEFNEGDLCVYFEIDSLLPEREEYEFIRKKCWNLRLKRYQIKTCQLLGIVSQGLAIPVHRLQKYFPDELILSEGIDVTHFLEVEKMKEPEPETARPGDINLYFNWPIAKTDEPRIQSKPKIRNLLEGKPYYISVKMDGTSVSFIYNVTKNKSLKQIDTERHFHVCSRNNEIIRSPDNLYWDIAIRYNIEQILENHYNRTQAQSQDENEMGESLSIQGEICGPKIQNNPLNLAKRELFIFNIVDTKKNKRLSYQKMIELIQKYNLPLVPILETGDMFSYQNEELFKLCHNHYANFILTAKPTTLIEGIVVRDQENTTSFKVINNEYLLRGTPPPF